MKKIFLVILLLSKIAVAQTESVVPTPSPTPIEKKEEQVAKPVEAVSEKPPIRYFIGLQYNGADNISFSSITYSDNTGSYGGSAAYKMDTAFGITGGVQNLKKGGWGYIFSGNYSLERSINTLNAKINTFNPLTVSYSDNKPKITVITLDGNGAFTFENDVYLLIGLNYSSINFKPPSGVTYKTTVKSALGYQFGIGFSVDRNIQIEIQSKTTKATVSENSPTAYLDYKTGEIQGLQISAKYLF